MEIDIPSPVPDLRSRAVKRSILRRRGTNYLIRAAAKRLAESTDPNFCESFDDHCSSGSWGTQFSNCRSAVNGDGFRRPHLEQHLRSLAADHRYLAACRNIQRRPRAPPAVSNCREEEEGRDLARSEVPLPSDGSRLVRRPTLEREEAFRVASTAKGKVYTRRVPQGTEDAQIAELYRQGLLYDNVEQAPEETFNLNSIQHEQPVYTIRPARRGRKSKKGASSVSRPLHLSLTLSDIGDFNDVTHYAASINSTDIIADEPIQHEAPEANETFPALRVIYELANSNPTFDVETSQPPDLITDTLSDYDVFSDNELDDDMPTQREVLENANNPSSETWIMLD